MRRHYTPFGIIVGGSFSDPEHIPPHTRSHRGDGCVEGSLLDHATTTAEQIDARTHPRSTTRHQYLLARAYLPITPTDLVTGEGMFRTASVYLGRKRIQCGYGALERERVWCFSLTRLNNSNNRTCMVVFSGAILCDL